MEATIERPTVQPPCCWRTRPRYPEIEVQAASAKPSLVIGATRQALRRAGVARTDIDDFSSQAFRSDDPVAVCGRWVRLVIGPSKPPEPSN